MHQGQIYQYVFNESKRVNWIMAFVEGGGDRYGLANLDRIICPDCGKAYLKRVQKEPDKLICSVCQLLISESQLRQEMTLVPQTGMGVNLSEKPYFQQTGANAIYTEPDRRPPFIPLDDESNKDILDRYSLKSLALSKTGGLDIKKNKNKRKQQGREEDTINAVKRLVRNLGTDIKVQLD